jgi:hypothetical protein
MYTDWLDYYDISHHYSAGLTILQVDGAEENPAIWTFVFLSLSSSILSLLLGCSYLLRFNNMKSMRRAARWVEVSCSQALADLPMLMKGTSSIAS